MARISVFAAAAVWLVTICLLSVQPKPLLPPLTNAERFQRGLPPAPPKNLYGRTRVQRRLWVFGNSKLRIEMISTPFGIARSPSTSPLPAQCLTTANSFAIRVEDDSGNSLGYLPNTTPTLWSGKLGSGLVPKSSAACFYTVASSGTEGAYLIRYVQTGLPGYFCIYGWGTPEYVYKLTQPMNSWGNYECPVWNLMGDDFSANWQWSPQYSREPLTFFLNPSNGGYFEASNTGDSVTPGSTRIHFFREA